MFVAVTLNPALDKIITAEGFSVGETLSAQSVRRIAGGKGINVARVINLLGGEVTATGFLGGPTGEFMEKELREEGLKTNFVGIKETTRSNTTVLDPVSGTETHLREPGPQISKKETDNFKKIFRKLIKKSRFLILSGSLPPGLRDNFYAELITEARDEEVKTILDTRGKALLKGIKACPFMIKPNRQEWEEIVGKRLNSRKSLIESIKPLLRQGIEIAIISLGKEGAIIAGRQTIWQAFPPRIKAVNSVGCGDALVAGFIYSLSRGDKMERAIRLGVAAAAANTLIPGAGFLRKKDIKKLYPKVRIKKYFPL